MVHSFSFYCKGPAVPWTLGDVAHERGLQKSHSSTSPALDPSLLPPPSVGHLLPATRTEQGGGEGGQCSAMDRGGAAMKAEQVCRLALPGVRTALTGGRGGGGQDCTQDPWTKGVGGWGKRAECCWQKWPDSLHWWRLLVEHVGMACGLPRLADACRGSRGVG